MMGAQKIMTGMQNRMNAVLLVSISLAVSSAVFLPAAPAGASNGISYDYDVLDRVVRISRDKPYTYTYKDSENIVTHTDERGNTSDYVYESFGAPGDKRLM